MNISNIIIFVSNNYENNIIKNYTQCLETITTIKHGNPEQFILKDPCFSL